MAGKESDPPAKSEQDDQETTKTPQEDKPIIVSRRQFNDFALI